MTDIKQMIVEQAARRDRLDAAYEAYHQAKEAYAAGSKAVTEALAEAGGYKVGQVIKLQNGGDAKIKYIQLSDGKELIAVCHTRTKNNNWSVRASYRVALKVKVEELI